MSAMKASIKTQNSAHFCLLHQKVAVAAINATILLVHKKNKGKITKLLRFFEKQLNSKA